MTEEGGSKYLSFYLSQGIGYFSVGRRNERAGSAERSASEQAELEVVYFFNICSRFYVH
jgi:hypothetical protein